jgi:RNA polymerase sigma factor (sigma-70 family)
MDTAPQTPATDRRPRPKPTGKPRPATRRNRDRDRIALRHAKLATIYAKKYVGRGVSFDDLVQEAWDGILYSAARFDESRAESFETYAKYAIRKRILKALKRCRPQAMAGDPKNALDAIRERNEVPADPGDARALEVVREGLAALSFNEARMLRLRHGIGFPAMSSHEAARAMGVWDSSGDRIYARAKAKLKMFIEGRDTAA